VLSQSWLGLGGSMLLGEQGIASTAPIELFGKNDMIVRPGSDGFRGGIMNRVLKDLGFKNLEEFPSDSPIHKVTQKWPKGGMARQLDNGEWEAIRWDPGHKNYGKINNPTEFQERVDRPHLNQQRYGLKDGELKPIPGENGGKGIFDHFPYFSFFFWNTIFHNEGNSKKVI
ncbi:hypothetical protein HZB01_00420, partial [Candidatus Woesearchaeota archaeon]|nr:hypothetical protein [Candidatus Woesearchaeota archaeon]